MQVISHLEQEIATIDAKIESYEHNIGELKKDRANCADLLFRARELWPEAKKKNGNGAGRRPKWIPMIEEMLGSEPARRGRLHKWLQHRGYRGTLQSLSSILSQCDQFRSEKGVWYFVEDMEEEADV